MHSLYELPDQALDNLLSFLPQQSLANLALTNFRFYHPCSKWLYRRIVVQIDPVLRDDSSLRSARRRLDFIDSSVTTINGFRSTAVSRQAHLSLVGAKIKTLTNAITINPELAQLVTSIDVLDVFNAEIHSALSSLLQTLAAVPNAISSIYIADDELRRSLDYRVLSRTFALSALVIDDLDQLSPENLKLFPSLNKIIVAGTGRTSRLELSSIPFLEKLVHMKIKDDPNVYDTFTEALTELYHRQPFTCKALRTFNVVHTHKNSNIALPYLDSSLLASFQISVGCDRYHTCNMHCMPESFARFQFDSLKRLSVVQNSDPRGNSHKNTEKWDLLVFDFVKSVLDTSQTLTYLSIRHSVPLDGIIVDGYEGNYHRKLKLYTILLPRLLSQVQSHVVNLVLPNFVASLSCYEQPMNTMLWNGCKCKHCSVYLEKLDDYLMYHRYFSAEKKVFKDIQTVQMMRTMSEVLADRMGYDVNVGDLEQLCRPMRNVQWNFHNCKFSIPFRCLAVKTYDLQDMEDDAEEANGGDERFFDAENTPNDCEFLCKEKFYPNYSIAVSHYVDDLIRRMINLNRGDAEEAEIGQINDENDGWTNLQVNKMLINGIDYNFDHEMNGTIFYTNSFDDNNHI